MLICLTIEHLFVSDNQVGDIVRLIDGSDRNQLDALILCKHPERTAFLLRQLPPSRRQTDFKILVHMTPFPIEIAIPYGLYYLAYLIQQVTLLNVLPLWIESIRKFDEQTNNVINNQKNQY